MCLSHANTNNNTPHILVFVYNSVAVDTVVKIPANRSVAQRMWLTNQAELSRLGAPSCYCDLELTMDAHTHTHTHIHLNALMLTACSSARKINALTHIT